MLQSLKHQAQLTGLIGVGLLFASFGCIHQFTPFNAVQWLLFAGSAWGYVWWQLWQGLDLNRASSQYALYPTLGAANYLSVLRGGLIAATSGFLLQPPTTELASWAPGMLYTLAAILDRIDGFVARRSKRTSLLGSKLDTTYDALGLLIAPLLAFNYGKVHWSFLLASIAYYFFCWGLYWRRTHNLPVYPLLPSQLRRTLAGFQMGCVALLLLPCFHAAFTTTVALIFMLPILLGFVVDWLVVSGRLTASVYIRIFFQRLASYNSIIFQPIARTTLVIAVLLLVSDDYFSGTTAMYFALIATAMVLLGFAGRIGAIAILLLTGLMQGDNIINTPVLVLIVCSTSVMLLGTGRFSLWQWDDRWIKRRDGEETE